MSMAVRSIRISWSADVNIEGKNVVRHLDMTTHNHGSPANEAIPWPHIGRMDLINSVAGCEKEKQKIKDECGDPIDENKAKCPNPPRRLRGPSRARPVTCRKSADRAAAKAQRP